MSTDHYSAIDLFARAAGVKTRTGVRRFFCRRSVIAEVVDIPLVESRAIAADLPVGQMDSVVDHGKSVRPPAGPHDADTAYLDNVTVMPMLRARRPLKCEVCRYSSATCVVRDGDKRIRSCEGCVPSGRLGVVLGGDGAA